ncbi:protein regulator of cytokinesis 1-like isoform X1 [Mytilus galloprovincialis]|uniref:protein regulator of cytokinesis 1-like isoform X1 n=1 Tax=Mytilus galloprovincialis TaxID=29158 RepID=UPI003F7CCE55
MSSPSQLRDELAKCLESSMQKFHNIWLDIGICESQQKQRSETVVEHLRNLLEEMVQEEEMLRSQIRTRIEKYSKEVRELCEDMSYPDYQFKKSYSMLQTEKDLKMRMETLSNEKAERFRKFNHFKDQDQHLCDIMCLTPYYIPSGSTPTLEQLQALENHVASLKIEKDKRFHEFVNSKKEIIKLFSEMEKSPETEFARDVVCESDSTFQLSTENMKALKVLKVELEEEKEEMKMKVDQLWNKLHVLWDRLDIGESERANFSKGKTSVKEPVVKALKEEISRCEKLKFQNIQRFVEGLRKELTEWWDKCYYSQQQKRAFTAFKSENFTEELLQLHDEEVLRMKTYYEKHHELFKDISKWADLFKKMLEHERKANDPNRFNNRGGKLLLEEKERKKVLKELPKVEEDVKALIADWEKQHEKPFLVDGRRFVDYIEKQWATHQSSKIIEKEERNKARAKLMEEEMIYGSKPTTPAKRRFIGTPSKTPTNKQRRIDYNSTGSSSCSSGTSSLRVTLKVKMNDTNKTPASCGRLQQNSVFASPRPRVPASASKILASSRRRSGRIARKVLGEKVNFGNSHMTTHYTTSTNQNDTFSQTTLGSCVQSGGVCNASTMESYHEFEKAVHHNSKANCRSSIIPKSPGKL